MEIEKLSSKKFIQTGVGFRRKFLSPPTPATGKNSARLIFENSHSPKDDLCLNLSPHLRKNFIRRNNKKPLNLTKISIKPIKIPKLKIERERNCSEISKYKFSIDADQKDLKTLKSTIETDISTNRTKFSQKRLPTITAKTPLEDLQDHLSFFKRYSTKEEYVLHVKKNVSESVGRKDFVKEEEYPLKKLQSKIGEAKEKREKENEKERKLTFWLEKNDPISQINSKCVVNLVREGHFLQRLRDSNQIKFKSFFSKE